MRIERGIMATASALLCMICAPAAVAGHHVLAADTSMTLAADARRSAAASFRSSYGLVPSEAVLREQVREPLLAFIFSMTEWDSLGTWSSMDLMSFADGWGRPSVFPLDSHIASMTREAVPVGQRQRLRGATCSRRWIVRLQPARIEVPMPFRILGYRPGKLSFQGPMYLEEWRLGERRVDLTLPEETHAFDLTGLTIYRVASGWLIMDVHNWLDRLLGDQLEDVAMEGFIVGLAAGELVGIGNSSSRRGRRLFGEMDLRTGKIETGGRYLALALSRYSRTWTRPAGFDHRAIWKAYER